MKQTFFDKLTAAVCMIAVAFGLAFAVQTANANTTNLALGYGYAAVAVPNVPATIAISTTATNFAVIDCRNFESVYVQLTSVLGFTNQAAATLSIPIHRSFNGTDFEKVAYTTLVLTHTGVVPITWATNMNLGGAGYFKVNQYVNSATNVATQSNFFIAGKQPIKVDFQGGVPSTTAGSR